MTLAVDSAVEGFDGYSASPSWSHTCSGSDRLLLVCIAYQRASGYVSGVTYNGVAMTMVARADGVGGIDPTAEIWKLSNPATGTNTVAVSSGTSAVSLGGSVSFTGANQNDATNTSYATNTGSDNSPTVNITSSGGEIVVDCVQGALSNGSAEPSPGGGQTVFASGTLVVQGHASSYEAGASTTTMSWTGTASAPYWGIAAVAVKPKKSQGFFRAGIF